MDRKGSCLISGCPGTAYQHGQTSVECDNPSCGFSTTVEDWENLAFQLRDYTRLVEIRNAVIIAKELGAGIQHGLTQVTCDNPKCGFTTTVEHWDALVSATRSNVDYQQLVGIVKNAVATLGEHSNRLEKLEDPEKPFDSGNCNTCDHYMVTGSCRISNDIKSNMCCYHTGLAK